MACYESKVALYLHKMKANSVQSCKD